MYDYRATCDRLIGPLTIKVDVDLGFHIHARTIVRLRHLEQPLGGADRKRAMALVTAWLGSHDPFTVRTFQSRREKYGRWLALVIGDDGSVLNNELLEAGLVKPFEGDELDEPLDE